MRRRMADLFQRDEKIVDLFAGGGGASTAIFMATGRHPDIAVNHNPTAIGMHMANHPTTRHYVCDVREVDPIEACTIDGVLQPIGLLWASPDCTHFSKARGGKPVAKGIRSLADVILVWAEKLRPRLIHLENVEEFQDWGPVLENGQPCPENKGLDFRRWVRTLHELGYKVDWRELVAADYGTPTTRKRLFVIARNDGAPIRWPAPTHASREKLAKGDLFTSGLLPWKSAAEHVIDWSIKVPSIFDRTRDLRPKTKARIARGIKRYVIDSPAPFIVPVTHTADGARGPRSAAEPLQTITRAKGGELAVSAPQIMPLTHHDTSDRMMAPQDPLRTETSANRGELGLMSALMIPRYGERAGQEPRVRDSEEPYPTVVPTGNGADLAGVFLARQFGSTVSGRDAAEPAPTVMSDGTGGKSGLVAACIDKYFGTGVAADVAEPLDTTTAKARFGLASAFLEQANTGMVGHDARRPLSTIVSGGAEHVGWGTTQRLIEVGMVPANEAADGKRFKVIAFLWEHFGEPTDGEWANPTGSPGARLKFGLVSIGGAFYQIVDIGMRMLVPRELFNAQGFPKDYIIDRMWDGTPISKTAQTSAAGNSVCPPLAEATLRANLTWMTLPERAAA